MKVRNAVVGMEVQVKRDCRGHDDEFIKEGFVCPIKWIDVEDDEGYELCLVHHDIDGGLAWVNASDVRRYKEEVPVLQVPEEPLKYLTKVNPKPKALTLQDIQVGDWVVCSDDRYGLIKGVAYEVLSVRSADGLYVSNPEREVWVTGYATRVGFFNKVLREVNYAASRVVEAGSESTCRSE